MLINSLNIRIDIWRLFLIRDSKMFVTIIRYNELEFYKLNEKTSLNTDCQQKLAIKRVKMHEFTLECCFLLP